jgi:hypothetical protein
MQDDDILRLINIAKDCGTDDKHIVSLFNSLLKVKIKRRL